MRLLKTGSFVKSKYRRMIFTCILSWMVCLIDSSADTLLAGAYISEAAVSGIALITPISSVISFLCYLISAGTALLYSREAGAFHNDKANKIAGQGLICSAIVAVFMVVSMLVLEDPILAFYSPSPEIAAYAREYYVCEIAFAAVYPFYYLLCQLVSIDGDDIIGLISCAVTSVGNLVISILMVGSLGVKGLAFGSAISSVLGILIYIIHFFRKTNSIHFRFQLCGKDIAEMVKLSSTTSLTLLYVAIIDIFMNKFVIAVFSDAYLPAYAVINLALNVCAIFSSSYEAASGFICVAYGEKNPESIKRTMRTAIKTALIESAFLLVLLEILATSIPSLYGVSSPEVFQACVFASRVIAISCPASALYYLFCGYYPAVGKIITGNILTAIYMLIAPLGLALPLGLAFGFNGMSVGFMLTSIVSILVIIIIVRIKYGRKAVPLILEESSEDSLAYDLYLDEESITELCKEVEKELASRNINTSISKEIQLILEESYMSIKDANPNRKVLSECNILIGSDSIRVITRDNGRIFDITDANARIESLRSFVLAQLMEKNPDRTHVTTISFNRNSYYWKL